MNFAIATTMLREQFQRTLPILVACLGISTLLCLIQYTVGMAYFTNASFDPGLAVFTIFLVHAGAILALLYCHSDERDMKVTMPAYLLRLPVRTIDLVLCRMGYGLLFMAVIGIGSSGVHYLVFGVEMESAFSFWVPFLSGTTTFAVLQALAWSIGMRGIVTLVVANQIVLLLSAWFGFEFNAVPFDPSRHIAAVILSTISVSILVAYAGVRTRRRGGFGSSTKVGVLSTTFARDRAVESPPFTSPEQAMRWFEWRRQSRMLPILVCGGSILFGITVLASNDLPPSELYATSTMLAMYGEILARLCFGVLTMAALSAGAICFFQNQRVQVGPQNTFLFIRPVSTKAIASARLAAVLRSVIISMIPLVFACAAAVLLASRSAHQDGLPVFVDKHTNLGGAGIALLLFFGTLAVIWCLQWFGNVIAMLAVLAICSLLLLPVFSGDLSGTEAMFSACVFGITAVVMMAASASLFYMAHRRDLLEKKNLYLALATWPFLVAGFLMLMHWESYVNGEESPIAFSLYGTSHVLALAVLPVAPLATVPLVMHYARHR